MKTISANSGRPLSKHDLELARTIFKAVRDYKKKAEAANSTAPKDGKNPMEAPGTLSYTRRCEKAIESREKGVTKIMEACILCDYRMGSEAFSAISDENAFDLSKQDRYALRFGRMAGMGKEAEKIAGMLLNSLRATIFEIAMLKAEEVSGQKQSDSSDKAKKYTFVFVDDDRYTLKFLEMMSKQCFASNKFVTATTGKAALDEVGKLVKAGKKPLVLLDFHMPGMGGDEIAREINRLYGSLVTMVGLTCDESADYGMKLPIMPKPILAKDDFKKTITDIMHAN